MTIDPADLLAGVSAALEDEHGVAPELPEEIHRLAAIVCSIVNEDDVYDKGDLRNWIKDTTPVWIEYTIRRG